MMKRTSILFSLLIGLTCTAFSQNAAQTKVLFVEDFDSYEVGDTSAGGRLKTEHSAGRIVEGESRQLMANPTFDWRSEPIEILNPLTASVSIDVQFESDAAEPDPQEETLLIILSQASADERPDRSGTVIVGGPWKPRQSTADLLQEHEGETFTLTTLPGALAAASTEKSNLQLIISARIASHQSLTIDNIRVEEQETDALDITLNKDSDLLNMNVWLEGLQDTGGGFYTLTPEEFAAEAFRIRVRYQAYRPGPIPVSLDLASLGDDDLCLGNPQRETNATDIEVRLIDVEEGSEEHEVVATYELIRPAQGWAVAYTSLWVCQESIRSMDGGTALVQSLGWVSLLENVSIFGIESPEVNNSDESAFVNVRFATDSVTPGDFKNGDVLVNVYGDQLEAAFVRAVSAPEGEPGYIATYRFDRPAIGWPPTDGHLSLRAGFGPPAIASRYSRNLGITLKTEVPEDAVTVALTSEGTPVAPSSAVNPRDDRFTFPVTFSSAHGIDLETFGDGDLLLERDHGADLPGRLVDVDASADGTTATATYTFARDPSTWTSGRLFFQAPSGAVSDLAGNTNRLQFAGSARLIEQTDQEAIQMGFIPLSEFQPELTSYHFRVAYQSKGNAAINLEDFDRRHVEVRQRSVDAQGREEIAAFEVLAVVQSLRPTDEGRLVEVDYSITKPAEGWPTYFDINVSPYGIRDQNGDSATQLRRLASLGPSLDNQSLSAQFFAGQSTASDSDRLQISLILQAGEDFYSSDVERSSLWLGWHPELLPGIEANAFPPVTSARLLSLNYIDGRRNAAVATFEIDRPEDGWDQWGAASLPFVFQGFAPASYNNSLSNPVLLSSFVTLTDSPRALPLLSSFEDWVKQLEEEAELPEGSLQGDLDGDQQEDLLEYALGGDPTDGTKQGQIKTDISSIDGQHYVSLTLSVRTIVTGVTIEVQQSTDGRTWQPAFSEFELVSLEAVSDEVEQWVLRSKEPLSQSQPCRLFRVVVAD